MLELAKLTSGYKSGQPVVDAVSLSLAPGSFVCVIGRNGAGKSTLMRTICGLQTALSGDAFLAGQSISAMGARERAQLLSVVTTERVSSPGLIARDVVELGRQPYTDWRGALKEKDLEIIHEALTQADAHQFASKAFDNLSDGQRQRVMIARSLAQSAQVLVLDEITAFLDLPGRVEIMALLRRHAIETGKIVLLSSHDLELSLELADQLWIVHEGKLFFGSGQQLVADGTVASAFDGKDVKFDSQNKKFVIR